jgi:hypothetical protein
MPLWHPQGAALPEFGPRHPDTRHTPTHQPKEKTMIHCRGCGQLIHETASTCPHCGAVQTSLVAATAPVAGTLWLPVPSFISAVVAVLAFAGEEHPGRDLAAGIGLFAGVAIVLSGVALARQSRGRGLAIAAMVLGVIAALAALGSQL